MENAVNNARLILFSAIYSDQEETANVLLLPLCGKSFLKSDPKTLWILQCRSLAQVSKVLFIQLCPSLPLKKGKHMLLPKEYAPYLSILIHQRALLPVLCSGIIIS
jgi:hypothetical protein